MKNQLFLIIGAMSVLFFACEQPTPAPEPKINDEWVYHMKQYDFNGNFLTEFDRVYQAQESIQDNNVAWAFLNDTNHLNEGWPGGIYRMNEDGLWYTSNATESYSALFLKYPGNVGEEYYYDIPGVYNYQVSIVSVNATLLVPYGNFTDLYQYTISSAGNPMYRVWFDENLWIVKFDFLGQGGTVITASYELASYTSH